MNEYDVPMVNEKQERMWGMWLHLSQLLGYTAVPVLGLAAPIVIWQVQKDRMPSLDEHGKVVVNWLISAAIYFAISFILLFVLVGIFLLWGLGILCVVFPIIGGLKANNGEVWHYPLSIRFLK